MKNNSPPVTAILLLLLLQLRFISSADVISDECSDRCGNLTVPYPFGIGDPKCAISSSFLFTCNSSAAATGGGGNEPQLVFGRNIAVQNISIEEGTFSGVMLAAYRCYNETGSMDRFRFNPAIRLGGGPFRFSNVYNKLTAFGCDTLAFMTDSRGTFGSGCVSLCDDVSAAVNVSESNSSAICSGIGCCQSSIPLGLKTLNFTVSSSKNHRGIVDWNPCDYAFLADVRVFEIGGVKLSQFPDRNPRSSSTAIEWVVEEKKCEVAKSNTTSYACRENSDCVYSENGNGYRCLCKPGFRGNPYLGCQDIDECAEPEKYPCHGKCKNTVGDYRCNCPVGMRGNGKVACQGFRVTAIVAVIGGIILLFTIILLVVILYKRRKKEKNFLQNGGMLLQHQRVRIFKASELSKATNNYDAAHFLGEGGFGHVYKGILADDNNTTTTLVAIKKPKENSMDKAQTINQEFQHEIAVVSQVNHINVVKVVGLCLETKLPLLVYEFIPNGTLFDHIHKQRSKAMSTWKHRLRIATEIAQALDYLHSLANPPIIHGDIKSTNILLDSEFRAKVSDFGASVLVSDQPAAMLNKIQGTLGYLDPEYLVTGNLNPKSDVYSFGVVMVELLTGEKPYSGTSVRTGEKINLIQYFLNSDLDKIVGFWGGDVDDGEMEEMEGFAEVARRCLNFSGLKRPAMKEVAEELGRLRKLNSTVGSYDEGTEETEYLLRKKMSDGFASSLSFGYSEEIWIGETEEHPPATATASQTHSVVALDMESYEICR
ncbi:Wall-associated receptor kinase 2 [Linum grandiflorum]